MSNTFNTDLNHEFDEDDELISKSQVKRQLHEIQILGSKLVDIPINTLEKHIVTVGLLQAIETAKKISSHIARKRQLKFIGKLLAKTDNDEFEALKKIIDNKEGKALQANQHFHQLEKWRDRLLYEQDQAISDLLAEYPQIDRQQIRQLVRNAKKETDQNKPPKYARQIFQVLKENIPL